VERRRRGHFCSENPKDDTSVTPMIRVRNGTSTVVLELGPYVQAGGCPGQITDESGWVHDQVGIAA
jgi:hypothetical protein